MSRYRFVIRAFPRTYWAEHGEEILATANELNDGSWSLRESRHLFAHGMRTRSLAATGANLEHVWTQGAAWVLSLATLGWTATMIAHLTGATTTWHFAGTTWAMAAFGLLAVAALTVSTRWPAMLPLVAIYGAQAAQTDDWLPSETFDWIDVATVAGLVAWIATRGSGRPAIRPATAVTLGALHIAALTSGVYLLGLAPLALFAFGLLLVTIEPRLLAAAAVSAVMVASSVAQTMVNGTNTPGADVPIVGLAVVSAVAIVSITLSTYGHRRLQRT